MIRLQRIKADNGLGQGYRYVCLDCDSKPLQAIRMQEHLFIFHNKNRMEATKIWMQAAHSLNDITEVK